MATRRPSQSVTLPLEESTPLSPQHVEVKDQVMALLAPKHRDAVSEETLIRCIRGYAHMPQHAQESAKVSVQPLDALPCMWHVPCLLVYVETNTC
jgi:hypothetical protein